MRVVVNGVRLFFDVEGASLVPDGPVMREKPTLLLLHGGPGLDHSIYKPAFSALADIAQVVFLDHRGHGRSDLGSPETWTLARWADDVRAFCDALGIAHPIVYGASFGGTVALFERFGGPEVGALARRRFIEGRGHTDVASVEAWLRLAFPLYTRTPRNPDVARRAVRHPEVTHWFTRPGGEGHTFNLVPDLSRVQCPTLVLGGEDDPMTPIECQAAIAAALPAHLVRFERFAGCGHAVLPDAPERALAVIREFIAR